MSNSNRFHSDSNRRDFIKTLGALGAGLAGVGAVRTASAAQAAVGSGDGGIVLCPGLGVCGFHRVR